MKNMHSISICLPAIVSLLVSCSKEPVLNRSSPSRFINVGTPGGSSSNTYPVDSLTGREFMFKELSWTSDSVGTVCIINRPDLFYLYYRPVIVSITVDGIQWMNVYSCPFPTDPFWFDWLAPGVLKFYVFNYSGPVNDSTTSIKVLFL
ncbi:MAG TPA: hypothetical protein VFP97_00700 [Chitinophagaceae bacterium]|nr:hypothetical protein [Chitinophagaceae bacterium]